MTVLKKVFKPKTDGVLPKYQALYMASATLEELAVLQLHLIPYNKDSNQTASNLLFTSARTRVIYGFAIPATLKGVL